MKRLVSTLFFLGLLASAAIGQGYITSHSIPIGQGPGVQGWGTGGPCAMGQGLVWQSGATSDPSCGTTVSTSPTTGGGAVVLQNTPYIVTPTIASPTIVSAFTAPKLVTNADLTNPSTSVNTINCTLGAACTVPTNISSPPTITINSQAIALGGSVTVPNSPVTGSGNVVEQSSPYVVTATIASPTIVSAFTAPGLVTNTDLTSSATVVNTINCVLGSGCTVPTNISSPTTGSGNVVLQSSPYVVTATIASPTIVSAFTAPGLVTNADLANSSTTVNSQTCTLGSSCTVPTNVSSPTTGSGNVVLQSSAYIVNSTLASPTIVSAYTAFGNQFTAVQGNGVKTQASSGTATSGDCVKFDANGNTVDAGVACPTTTGPTQQAFTTSSATTQTYTTPAGTIWIEILAIGGGGGGGGVGASTGLQGGGGGTTTFASISVAGATGGGGTNTSNSIVAGGGGGATATTGTGPLGYAITGNPGGPGFSKINLGSNGPYGGFGGGSCIGGGGAPTVSSGNGTAGGTNAGGGGGGAANTAGGFGAAGGGAGACAFAFILTPAPSYAFTVGGGGLGGAGTGTNSQSGGPGGTGYIRVIEHYSH